MKTTSPIRSYFSLSALLAINLAAVPLAAAESHLVRKGDNITSIAREHGCTAGELRSVNQLKGDLIKPGERLTLPAKVKKDSTPDGVKKPAPDKVKLSATEKKKPQPKKAIEPEPKKEIKLLPKPDAKSKPGSPLSATIAGLSGDDRWRVQIFLDQSGFPPGKVDGLPGEFTLKAAQRWMAAGEGRTPESLLAAAREKVVEIHIRVAIPQIAAEFVGALPVSHEAQAKARRLPYRTLAEMMAERFHTDESALRRLNPGLTPGTLRIGQSLTVPAVVPFRIEDRKKALTSPGSEAAGAVVRILHSENMLEVARADGSLAASFPITVGRKPEHVRTGTWKIVSRHMDPTFLYDKEMLAHGKSGKVQHLLPPGPNNPVGILWMELEPVKGPEAHIGIHGTDSSARIGRNQSSGCIRLANWDIVRLARLTRAGTRVVWGRPATRGADSASAKSNLAANAPQ